MGRVEEIYIAASKKAPVIKVESAVLEAGKGIVGDRYHLFAEKLLAAGQAVLDNHLTLISREVLDDFLAAHPAELGYGDFRRSVITSGIDLNQLVGKEFRLGGALCRGAELCEPCTTLQKMVHSEVIPHLVNRGGLRAVILESGEIESGSEITAD
ncbi:MAG: MOSC domain-containing protein [Gammaproteobacteria bacterium]